MLNSTLHLNVFGRVNTALIDKDSQCIYQLSRLSTLSHWSLPWSRGGVGGEPEKQGNGTAVVLKSASAHLSPPLILFCNLVLAVVSSARSCSPALWGAAVLQRVTRDNTRAHARNHLYRVASHRARFFAFILYEMSWHLLYLKRGGKLAYYHLNNPSTCGSGPTGRGRENIVGNEGEWPLFIFQWTARGLHRPNPGTIHPQTRTLPFP